MDSKTREKIFAALPEGLGRELNSILGGRGGIGSLSELKLRSLGASSAVVSGERVRLFYPVGREGLSHALEVLSDGAIYSHRDTICRGFLSLSSGVRVGISGTARYDGGSLVGVSDISSLVFRIPTGEFEARAELVRVFSECSRGILVFSPPGLGKTSALRALARDLSALGEEIAVVDERCEFPEEDFRGASVDILRGYKRAEGIEIALRTLSPSVIIVDEVGRLSEAEAMLESLSSGVKVLVSAHAGTADEARSRAALAPFFEHGAVDRLVGIEIREGRRVLSVLEV